MRKFIPLLIIIVVVIGVVLILNQLGFLKTMSAEELEQSIKITDIKTKWVEKFYQPWPPKLTLVPAISFKIKNVSDKPLKYINVNANFRFRDDYENLGDSFLAAIRGEAIPPGESSDTILLKSNYGVEGSNKAHFQNNPQWKVVVCKLFVKSRGSSFIEVGEYAVTKEIDFEEPEDVGLEPVKKKEEKKTEEKK